MPYYRVTQLQLSNLFVFVVCLCVCVCLRVYASAVVGFQYGS